MIKLFYYDERQGEQMNAKNQFLKYFWTYTSAVLIVLAAIGIFVSGALFSKLEKDTLLLNKQIINQIQNKQDDLFFKTLTIAYYAKENETIDELLGNRPSELSDKVLAQKAIDELKRYRAGNSWLRNTVVCNFNNDIAIDFNSVYSVRELYSKFFGEDQTYEEWKSTVNSKKYFHSFLKTNEENLLVYNQHIDGKVFFAFIDKAQILKNFSLSNMKSKINFVMLDSKGNILVKSDEFDLTAHEAASIEGQVKKNKMLIISDNSDAIDAKYVYYFPKNGIAGNVNYIGYLFFILTIAAIGICFVVALLSSKRVCDPLNALIRKNNLLSEHLDEQIRGLKERNVYNLLHNRISPDDEDNAAEELGMRKGCFNVFLINIVDNEGAKEIWYNLNKIVKEQLKLSNVNSYYVADKKGYAYMVNYDGEDVLSDALERTYELLCDKIKIAVSIALGKECENIYEIYKSYEKAYFASKHILETSGKGMVLYKDIQDMESSCFVYTGEKKTALVRAMRTGDEGAAAKIFDEIYKENLEERQLSYETRRKLVLYISMTVYKILDEAYQPQKEKQELYNRKCEKAISCSNITDSMAALKDVCISICRDVNVMNGGNQIRTKIEAFVNENYSNADLSLDMLSEYLGVSYHYASHMFKGCMNMGFTEYVTTIRMEKAKKMLEETNCLIEKIAGDTGFANVNTFINVFKKYYDITPGKYRKDKRA